MSKPADRKQVKKETPGASGRTIRHGEAVAAARRFRISYDGSRQVIRFSFTQRVEHLALFVSVAMLALTGLTQSYYTTPYGLTLLKWMGGIDSARQIHHAFAFALAGLTIYHTVRIMDQTFVHSRPNKIRFENADLGHFLNWLRGSLGGRVARPQYDRYNFEQKVDYWALVIGIIIIGMSGVVQLFPLFFTQILPGWIIPLARAIHRWQSILIVLWVLVWHLYHTVIKKLNLSMLNGVMSMEEMHREHPLELRYLERASAVVRSSEWPVFIDLSSKDDIPLQAAEPEPVSEPQAAAGLETHGAESDEEGSAQAASAPIPASGETQA